MGLRSKWSFTLALGIFGMIILSACKKDDDRTPGSPGHGGPYSIYMSYWGQTSYGCQDSSSGQYADTIRVYSIPGQEWAQALIQGDTFTRITATDAETLAFHHLNSVAKFHWDHPYDPAFHFDLTWPGTDGPGDPECNYAFASDN